MVLSSLVEFFNRDAADWTHNHCAHEHWDIGADNDACRGNCADDTAAVTIDDFTAREAD